MSPLSTIARIFARNPNSKRVDLQAAEPAANPVADKHAPHARVAMPVNALHHALNLTLPAKPEHTTGEQGFAVIHTEGDDAAHAAITSRLGAFPGRVASRVWHNSAGEDAVAPGHGAGRYISLRGDANALKHIVARSNVTHAIAHASENVA